MYKTDTLLAAEPTNEFNIRVDGELELQECEPDEDDEDNELCKEYLGQIVVEGAITLQIRPSMESAYPGSFITLEKDGDVYSVNRFSLDGDGNLATEMVFETESSMAISDVYLFDDYALIFSDGSTFSMGYISDFIGDSVPSNYIIKLADSDAIRGHAISKSSDGSGDPELYIGAMTSASYLIKRMKVIYDPNYNSKVVEDEASSIALLDSVKLSAIKVTPNLIIAGCSTCNDGEGWINFYDRKTMGLLHSESGTDDAMAIGTTLAISGDISNVTHVWYTSIKGVTISLNSIYLANDAENDTWDVDVQDNKFSIAGASVLDKLVIAGIGDEVIFKLTSAT